MLWLTLLIALVAAAAAGLALFFADRRRSTPYPLITASLRGCLVFLVIFLLLAPDIRSKDIRTEKPSILLLQDNSASVGSALADAGTAYRKEMEQLIARLGKKYRVLTWSLQGNTPADSLFHYSLQSTDIAAALNDAGNQYGQQNLGAVILATDGRYNEGANPLYTTLPANTSLYTVAIGDTSRLHDLRIAKIYANKSVSLNSQFEIRADVLASGCKGYAQTATLKDAQGASLATAALSVNSDRYDATLSFSVKAEKAGLQQYILQLPASEGEINLANNQVSIFVEVIAEKKKILLVAAAPHPDIQAIRSALDGLAQYELKTSTGLPANLQEYACLILHGIPALRQDISSQLLQAGKSAWYITTAQSNYPALNQLQQAVRFPANNPMLRDATPVFQSGFSAFSLPADIRAITDRLPPLQAALGDLNLSGNALFSQASGQPLWVLQPGKIPTALLCGEGLWRWRMYEYRYFNKHNTIDECIRQTVQFLCTGNNDKPFRAEMPSYVWHYPSQVIANAYLYNNNQELVNQPEATISITDSTGNSKAFSFERNGSAYRLNAGTLIPGHYRFTAKTSFNGRSYTDAGSFVVDASSPEAAESGCDYPLLYTMAQRNGGHIFQPGQLSALYDSLEQNDHIRPLLTETTRTAPLVDRKWLFVLILALATAEWLLRKYWMAM